MVGVVVDPAQGVEGLEVARSTVIEAGMVPLVIAPAGGRLDVS
jgi:catalase